MKLEYSAQIFEKKLKYQVSSKSVQWEPSCFMQTDRQTDTTELIVAFCTFANAPKNTSRVSCKDKLNMPAHFFLAIWGFIRSSSFQANFMLTPIRVCPL